jgi:YfiR/HmsC-like
MAQVDSKLEIRNRLRKGCTGGGPFPGRWLAAVAGVWACAAILSMQAQQVKPSEYQVKAAYLYNFGRFIEWPAKVTEAGGGSFPICVLGQDPFGPTLTATLSGETINGKSVVARRIPGPEEATDCRIVFISASESDRLKQILASLADASVLTVSDLPGFSQRGGMVQLTMEGNRVRFEVNLTSTARAGLTLSSELLKVAINVRGRAQVGD